MIEDASHLIALAVFLAIAVLLALYLERVERCASTPCDFGAPTLIDGECTCTAPVAQ